MNDSPVPVSPAGEVGQAVSFPIRCIRSFCKRMVGREVTDWQISTVAFQQKIINGSPVADLEDLSSGDLKKLYRWSMRNIFEEGIRSYRGAYSQFAP